MLLLLLLRFLFLEQNMGVAQSKKAVSLNVESVGVINVFPDSPPNSSSSPPAVMPCHYNHNITFPSPPPPPSPGSLRRPDDNIPKKKKGTENNESSSHPIMNNPGVFSDFGKQANDLLAKDYYNKDMDKNFFSLGTHSNAGVDLTLTTLKKNTITTSSSTDHGFSIGDLTASYKSKNNNNSFINLKIINEAGSGVNSFATKTQLHYVVDPSLGANVFMYMEYPDWESTKLGEEISPNSYSHFTAATRFGEFPIFEGSATIGTPEFAIGGDVVCDTKMDEIKGRTGIRHTNSIFNVSALVSSDDGTLKVSCVHHLDVMKKNCAVAELCFRSDECATLTVGTSFEVNNPLKEDMKTVVNAKLDSHGNMGVVLQQQLIGDKMVKICSEFDTMDLNKTPKIGLSLVL